MSLGASRIHVSARRRLALLVAAWLCVAGECGLDAASKTLNEPCTRDRECEAPLVCSAGACAPPWDGAIPDAAISDAAISDAAISDAAISDASSD